MCALPLFFCALTAVLVGASARTASMTDSTPTYPPLAPAVLVTGKGGVGKTTLAAGLALAAVERGTPAILIEFGDGESGLRSLGRDRGRVTHEVIDPDQALARAATPLFGSKLLSKLVLGNFAMRKLLRAAPGIREIAMLESVRQVVENNPGHRVVVDMPATGHGLGWLRLPSQAAGIVSPSPFRGLIDRVSNELIAPGKCSVVVVTLPERLVLSETIELCAAMADEVSIPAARLVVNRMPDPVEDGAIEAASKLRSELEAGSDDRDAAAALEQALEVRHRARSEAMASVTDVLGRNPDAASRFPVVLPLSPVDPPAHLVAAWLIHEGAA